MPVKKKNAMKVTLWTENVKVDMSGSISACVIECFNSIMGNGPKSAAEVREVALKLMTDAHERLKAEGL